MGGGEEGGSGTGSVLHLLINESIHSHLKCLLELFCRSHETVDQWLYATKKNDLKAEKAACSLASIPILCCVPPFLLPGTLSLTQSQRKRAQVRSVWKSGSIDAPSRCCKKETWSSPKNGHLPKAAKERRGSNEELS